MMRKRIRYSRQTPIVRTAPAVCAQPVDVPSTLLTGEITALALRVSCAFAFAVNAKLCNAENSATRTLQRTTKRGSHVSYAWFFRSVSCKAVVAAALWCLFHVADCVHCPLYVACSMMQTVYVVYCMLHVACCMLHVADCVRCVSSVALRGCRSKGDGVVLILFEALKTATVD